MRPVPSAAPEPQTPDTFRLEPSPGPSADASVEPSAGQPGALERRAVRASGAFIAEMIERFQDRPDSTLDLMAPFGGIAAQDERGRTMLHWTVVHRPDDVRTVSALLERGAALEQPDAEGETPLSLAFAGSRSRLHPAPVIRALLLAGAAPAFLQRARGWRSGSTPLHDAVLGGATAEWTEVLNLLIVRHADLEAVNADGHTALHLAARDHRPMALQRLLNAGASVNATDPRGNTPLVLMLGGHQDVPDRNRRSAVIDPPARLRMVRALLDAGADPSARGTTPNGATESLLARVAAQTVPDVPVFVALVEAGADPDETLPTAHRPERDHLRAGPPGRETPWTRIMTVVNQEPDASGLPLRVALENALLQHEARRSANVVAPGVPRARL